MELQTKIVTVEGYGEFEIREPLFGDVESMFGEGEASKSMAMDLMKKCIFKDGELVFSKPVGARLGMQLLKLAPEVLKLAGLTTEGEDGEKKD